MSDHLKDLQRQRALAQEQLEWFDREIARESGVAPRPVAPATPAAASSTAAPAAVSRDQAAIDKEAAAILERFRHVEHPIRDDVKRGCLIYFFLALGMVVLALIGFYFLKRNSVI